MTVETDAAFAPTKSFQGLILTLQRYWAKQGCVILQPYDMEMGAGTFHPATTLRALGPKPWRAAYAQPCRRPKDGRYGENPNRVQHYYQFQVILKPSPPDLQYLYLASLAAIGLDAKLHDIRFVEDDWESPHARRLGTRVGVLVRRHGGLAVHLFSAGCGHRMPRLCRASSPMASSASPAICKASNSIMQLNFNGREGDEKISYGDVFLQAEQEYSRHNFEYADTQKLFSDFSAAENECKRLLTLGGDKPEERHLLSLPAYDQCIKASHVFNLLDARGVISVTERQSYIARVRELAKACGAAWARTEIGRFSRLKSSLNVKIGNETRPCAFRGRALRSNGIVRAMRNRVRSEGGSEF